MLSAEVDVTHLLFVLHHTRAHRMPSLVVGAEMREIYIKFIHTNHHIS